MAYWLFIVSLLGLWAGADVVIRGSLGIARKIGLSETFVGMTILALGTNLPEIIISITGAIEQSRGATTTGLVIGNIMGSNIGNISLILGLAGVLKIININKREIITNGSAMIASFLAFYLFAQDGIISRTDGLFLLLGFIFYMLLLSSNERKSFKILRLSKKNKRNRALKKSGGKSIWWFLSQLTLGLVIISIASYYVLQEGLLVAQLLNINPILVGIIMIGIGSSLPELVVSISAILRGSTGLSVGNLIGSNVINIFLALGVSSLITEWRIPRVILSFDLPFLMVTSIIIILFLLSRKKLERKESFLILALYYGYIMLKLQGF